MKYGVITASSGANVSLGGEGGVGTIVGSAIQLYQQRKNKQRCATNDLSSPTNHAPKVLES